jgi:hypothetical protein
MNIKQLLERTLNTQFNVDYEEITQATKTKTKTNMWIIIAVVIIIIGIILYKKNQDKESDNKK